MIIQFCSQLVGINISILNSEYCKQKCLNSFFTLQLTIVKEESWFAGGFDLNTLRVDVKSFESAEKKLRIEKISGYVVWSQYL